MNFNLIRKGLQKLIADGIDVAEAEKSIAEIKEIEQRVGGDDIYNGECYVLHAATVCDVLLETTYDLYSKLYAKASEYGPRPKVLFNDYEQICRHRAGLEYAPLSMIQVGYELVGDLYQDNEDNGCHINNISTDLKLMYTDNGLRILYDIIEPVMSKLLEETASDDEIEPANKQLAVLSNLYETLVDLIK